MCVEFVWKAQDVKVGCLINVSAWEKVFLLKRLTDTRQGID